MNKLTNEEISRVKGMYLYSCNVRLEFNQGWNPQPEELLTEDNFSNERIIKGELLLTPLSKISDEHAIEVAKILGMDTSNTLIRRKENSFNDQFVQLYYLHEDEYGTHERVQLNISNSLLHANNNRLIEEYYAIEYLKLRGYAVPLFFGLNHWANGKTAIQLGIAINKNTLK